ncbi:putative transposase DNA-binding domain protein [Micromonospora sp. MW-13]|uniref:helix-turn-helix domain-containing protein n=1 Tax=Micromonospora sp. MW-13 TaxID=2094022 RepID=UPI000E438E56|nr:helix-turn-helix domain-containing protein [Micromonospora sp. MW-13]RGC69153.1 putative transposase DNA-binding domain protein [Micromonospora sp. MW-13]
MVSRGVKRAFKYRFHPSDAQAAELTRTFGCVRLVYNGLAFLNEVSSVPLQQALRHLARNMVKNHSLARAISDAAWRQFRTLLEYKTDWHGRNLVVVDRWFPSSKLCSTCGARAERIPLTVRSWTCRCGTVHDRDVNAARNILAAGLAVTACGDGVRPQRGNLRSGQLSVKQEHLRATTGIPVL